MILLDVNVLMYAYDSTCPQFAKVRSWLQSVLDSEEAIALPWQTVLSFLRLATDRRLGGAEPLIQNAVEAAEWWLTLPQCVPVSLDNRTWQILNTEIRTGSLAGNLIPDAALAALALGLDATLVSADRDFARFPNLRWVNPLD